MPLRSFANAGGDCCKRPWTRGTTDIIEIEPSGNTIFAGANVDHPGNGACLCDAAKWISCGEIGDEGEVRRTIMAFERAERGLPVEVWPTLPDRTGPARARFSPPRTPCR